VSDLLAKSFHGETPPHEATLLGHLQAVHAAALTIIDACGEAMLATFRLPTSDLTRFRQIVAIAAAIHDVGKANSHFQGMLNASADRSRYNFRQALRHEWVSLLWPQQSMVAQWIKEVLPDEADILILECCVAGHHPGANVPRLRPVSTVRVRRWPHRFMLRTLFRSPTG